MTYKPITLEELGGALAEIPRQPDFSAWASNAFHNGTLDLVLQGILHAKLAENNTECLHYLANYLSSRKTVQKVTLGDLKNTPPSKKLFWTLTEIITQEKKTVTARDRSRYYGVISHLAIPELLLGNLINLDTVPRKKQNGFYSQGTIFEEEEIAPTKSMLRSYKKSNHPKTRLQILKFIDKVEASWKEVHKEMRHGKFQLYSRHYAFIRECIGTIFEEYALRVANYGIFMDENLTFITLMTWVGALMYYRQTGTKVFFQELFLLRFQADIGAGRLDELEVITIDGVAPNKYELVKIKSLTNRKWNSVGQLIVILLQTFNGKYLEFLIKDWKFAAGDNINGFHDDVNIIETSDVIASPLKKHVDQISRYITMTHFSYALEVWQEPSIEQIWNTDMFSVKGELVYFLPDSMPITHEVTMTKEAMYNVFNEQIASRIRGAKRYSAIRKIEYKVIKHTIKAINGTHDKHQRIFQPEFEGFSEQTHSSKHQVLSLVENLRIHRWSDDLKITETYKTQRGEKLKLNFNRLLECLKDGSVELGKKSWNETSGGFCKCWFHNERSASMKIDLRKGIFKCFGCGKSGIISRESIPEDLQIFVNTKSSKLSKAMRDIVIPERHREIMLAAQEIFQTNFLESPGAKYLEKDRGLNPEKSMQIGAGYANEWSVIDLIKKGFSYDELFKYGFLRVSTKTRRDSLLIELLQREAGLLLEDIVKIVISKKDFSKEEALPVFLLNNKVTYPLEIHGIINSFYGRYADKNCPKEFRHAKLFTGENMPHGAFHLTEAMRMGSRIILGAEGPIDVDTLIQKGNVKSCFGFIGVDNPAILELVSEFDGDIALAFDIDEKNEDERKSLTGQKMTIKAFKKLLEYDANKKIYNFSEQFSFLHPGKKYHDPNQYWLDYRERMDIDFALFTAEPMKLVL